MKEVWHGSDPEPVRRGDTVMRHRGGAVVGWWWTFWIALSIVSQVAFRLAMNAESIDALVSASWADVISDLLTVPAAIVTILMIRAVTANQDERHQFLKPAATAPLFA